MKKEIWKPIFGGVYAVSNRGRIKRAVLHRNSRPGGKVRGFVGSRGYRQVTIHGKTYMVHRLVASAFLGPMPKGLQTDHKNGNKRVNRATNLEYVTPIENSQRAVKLGLKPRGERHYAAQLGDSEVREIRQRYRTQRVHGLGRSLADEFGVSYATIMSIVHRQSWRHI